MGGRETVRANGEGTRGNHEHRSRTPTAVTQCLRGLCNLQAAFRDASYDRDNVPVVSNLQVTATV